MGVVAAGAEIINPFARTGKVSHPFSVNTCPPIPILIAVTFAAKSIAFCKIDQLPVIEPELISIVRIMTVETPPHRFGVMKFNICMLFFQLPFLPIDLHRGVAAAAGVHSLGHRRRGILLNDCGESGSEKKQQKQRGYCCGEYSHDRSMAFLSNQGYLNHPRAIKHKPKTHYKHLSWQIATCSLLIASLPSACLTRLFMPLSFGSV